MTKKEAPPSDAAKAAAISLMAVPIALESMTQQLQELTEAFKKTEALITMLAEHVLSQRFGHPVQIKSIQELPSNELRPSPIPGIYFLNDAHTTHITKSQARRERREFKKKQAEEEAQKRSASARKSRPSRRHDR